MNQTLKNKARMPLLVLLLVLLSSALAFDCNIASKSPVTLAGNAVVCLHVTLDGTTLTYAFQLTVDKFSAITINGLKAKIDAATLAEVQIQFQNTNINQTQTMLIFNKTTQRYRQIMSFVIQINGGVFSSIAQDNADCGSCTSGQVCQNNECFSTGSTGVSIDPRFFVSWIGTDSNNDNCISYARRLSRFTQYSIGSIYSAAQSMFQ